MQRAATITRLASKRAAAPTAVRVASADMVPALQRALGRSVVIEVAPTPEVGPVVAAFVAADDERGGADDPFELLALDETHRSEIARFCTAAAAVYRLAPWETLATDDDVMMFDAPALGLNRACITVTGQLRETFGVLWIASAQDYRRYRAGLAQRDVGEGEGMPPVALGLVTFEPLDDAPPALRKEILRRKWSLAGPAALPYPVRLDTEGQHVPFRIEDVRLATVIFEALAGFLAQHGEGVRSMLPASGWYPVASARGEVAIVVAYPPPDQTGPDDDDIDDDPDDDDPTCRMFAVAWRSEFTLRQPKELAAARKAVAFAFLGRPAKATELDVDGHHARVLELGAQARFLFGEAVRLDLARGTVTIRDLHDGVCYEILGPPPEQLRIYTRGMRFFGVIIPIGDRRWTFPSVLMGSSEFARIDLATLVSRTREALAGLRLPVDAIDPLAPGPGLLRYAGIAYAVLLRIAEEGRPAPLPPR